MFTTTFIIVDSLFLSWWRTKSEFAPDSCLRIPFTEISMLPFYGWGGFQIRLARRRAHPCDEQVVAITCSFSLFFHVKVLGSILWVGLAEQGCTGAPLEVTGGVMHRQGSDQRAGRGRSAAAL